MGPAAQVAEVFLVSAEEGDAKYEILVRRPLGVCVNMACIHMCASIEDATGTGEMAGAAIAQETVVGFCEAEVDWEFLQRKELCHNLEPWF